jgi:hypothetical protein
MLTDYLNVMIKEFTGSSKNKFTNNQHTNEINEKIT